MVCFEKENLQISFHFETVPKNESKNIRLCIKHAQKWLQVHSTRLTLHHSNIVAKCSQNNSHDANLSPMARHQAQ